MASAFKRMSLVKSDQDKNMAEESVDSAPDQQSDKGSAVQSDNDSEMEIEENPAKINLEVSHRFACLIKTVG